MALVVQSSLTILPLPFISLSICSSVYLFAFWFSVSNTCAAELGQGIRTEKHIGYFMRQLDSVSRLGLTPVVVFDGRELPGKAQTELDRKKFD